MLCILLNTTTTTYIQHTHNIHLNLEPIMLTKLNLLKFVKKFSKSLSLSIADKKCTSNNNNNNSKRCRKCSKLHKSSMIYVLHEEVNDEDEFFIDFQKMCMLQKQRQNLKQWFSICWSNERCGKKNQSARWNKWYL